MNPLTAEWVHKAEGDYRVAMRLLQDDAICFHAQQCVEKYLKAVLQDGSISFPKTHNLVELARLCAPLLPEVMPLGSPLNTLPRSAIEVRYPGAFASVDDSDASVNVMIRVRGITHRKLGLER